MNVNSGQTKSQISLLSHYCSSGHSFSGSTISFTSSLDDGNQEFMSLLVNASLKGIDGAVTLKMQGHQMPRDRLMPDPRDRQFEKMPH